MHKIGLFVILLKMRHNGFGLCVRADLASLIFNSGHKTVNPALKLN